MVGCTQTCLSCSRMHDGLTGSQVYYYENGKWILSGQPMSRFELMVSRVDVGSIIHENREKKVRQRKKSSGLAGAFGPELFGRDAS